MIDRILPFLNHLVPSYIAMKGLGKVDPRFAKFFAGALGTGYTVDQALGYLRNRISPTGKVAEENRLQQGVQRGNLRPDERAAYEKMQQRNAPLNAAQSAISTAAGGVGGVLGSLIPNSSERGEQSQPQQPHPPMSPREEAMRKMNEMRKKKSMIEQSQEEFEKTYGPGLKDIQSQSNTNDDQLISAMQKILSL